MNQSTLDPSSCNRIAIIGGGLSGLAAAWALSDRRLHVDLFEAKRRCGGRAGSFLDPVSQTEVDYCQHVAMGCCTNFRKLIEQTELESSFVVTKDLVFLHQNCQPSIFRRRRFLPTPLDLAPDFLGLHFLSWKEKLRISRAMYSLMRPGVVGPTETMGNWLRRHHQSQEGIRDFWDIILASALGEKVDKVAFAPARKVFVDGFLACSKASEILIPRAPLSDLFGDQLPSKLAQRGVNLFFNHPVRRLERSEEGRLSISRTPSDQASNDQYDAVIVAVPWHGIERLFATEEAHRWIPNLSNFTQFPASPISGIHLWFDQAPTSLPHAVIVDRLCQWIFQPSALPAVKGALCESKANAIRVGDYLQVVVSASHDLRGREHRDILEEVLRDFSELLPLTTGKHLLRHARVVTDPNAVFSITPQVESLRPKTKTQLPGLFLAGDWVQTGWPATMEGAVKSGFEAAEAVLNYFGKPRPIVAPDLKKSPLIRLLAK